MNKTYAGHTWETITDAAGDVYIAINDDGIIVLELDDLDQMRQAILNGTEQSPGF